jgi:hypothetical protein
LCVAAALVPLAPVGRGADRVGDGFRGWPVVFEGHDLKELPLSGREERFAHGFPGRIGRFTDGEREIVIRWATTPSRRLHPAQDCFRGLGYDIHDRPAMTDDRGRRWSCFDAERQGTTLLVRERIHDGAGQGWTDVSSWYWAAVLGDTAGPWWAVTVAERPTPGSHNKWTSD